MCIVVVGELRATPEGTPRDANHDGQGRSWAPVPHRCERSVLAAMVEQSREVGRRVAAEAGEVGVHVGQGGPETRRDGGKFQEVADVGGDVVTEPQ